MLETRTKDRTGDRVENDSQYSLQGVIRFVRENRKTILVSALVSASLAAFYSLTATPIFTAKTHLLIDARVPQPFKEQGLEGIAALDTPEVESRLAIIKSQNIEDRVINKLSLLSDPRFTEAAAWDVFKVVGYIPSLMLSPLSGEPSEAETDAKLRAARNKIHDGLKAVRIGLSHDIEISYSSADRRLSADIANGIADSYIDEQSEAGAEAARKGSAWLEARIESLRSQMDRAAFRLQEFKAKRDYRIMDADKVASATLVDLESQANTYRRIYEGYLQALADSVQRQAYPETNARIITRATPPRRKSFPRGSILISAGLVAGLFFGAGLALLYREFQIYSRPGPHMRESS
jgi:uncharacterized protein involved in exopolysaccharide biosynthesis